jgi:DnaJ-class molecular chaperone
MPTKRDYYEILGVSKSSSKEEIKSAYRKKALEFHPDRNKDSGAEEKFKEVNEAYQVLSDDQKKQAYDQFGHSAFDPSSGFGGNPFSGGFRQGPFTYTYSNSGNPFGGFDGGDFSDPFEIFESFFGGNPFSGGRAKRKPRYSLRISFMDAAKGAEKTVEIEGKQRTIKIPPGADDGTRMRFQDFDLTLDVEPHKTFKRDGYDVYVDKEISLTMAILGGAIEVPTIDGEVKLKVRPGTQPNTMVRLRGQGIQVLQGRGRGDEYVRLVVKIPEKISKRQKELVEEFEKIN